MKGNEWSYPSDAPPWSWRKLAQSIMLAVAILVGLALLVLSFERAGPEEGNARPPISEQVKPSTAEQELNNRVERLERELRFRESEERIKGER